MPSPVWEKCVSCLQEELPSQQFNTWIKPLKAEYQHTQEAGDLHLYAPNRFVKEWVMDKFLERINELRAVETIEAMKKSDVYLDAVKNSAKAPVNYGKALIDAPVDTLKGTARGLGGFLADVGSSVVSDDPSQDNVAKTGLGQSAAKRNFAFELGVNPYSRYEPLQEALSEVSPPS